MLSHFAAEVAEIPGIKHQGLMGLAPAGEEPRPYFREIRHLYDSLQGSARWILSMGMTGDFETAIEKGATMTGRSDGRMMKRRTGGLAAR